MTDPLCRTSRRDFLQGVAGAAVASATALPLPSCKGTGRRGPVDSSSTPPVVDTHMHVWANDPERFPFPHPYDTSFRHVNVPHEATARMLLDDMDSCGVTHSVLVQVIYHGWDNSYVAECVRSHPDRFVGHGLIDPTDPRVAERLEYWVKEHGLAGMRFSAIYYRDGAKGGDGWIDSPAHDRAWRKARDLGAVFNFFLAPDQIPRLERMLTRHPEVTVCIDHLAQMDLSVENPEPQMRLLLSLAKHDNVRVKISELTSVAGTTYPFRESYSHLKRVYEAFGPDRLLWGTGYPGAARGSYGRPTLEEELALVRDELPFLDDEAREKMLGRNAALVWNLRVTTAAGADRSP